MFTLEKFCEDAEQGNPVEDLQGFCDYVRQFQNVVLWGAGNLGKAVGAKFAQLGLKISVYWDAKYDDKADIDGISCN